MTPRAIRSFTANPLRPGLRPFRLLDVLLDFPTQGAVAAVKKFPSIALPILALAALALGSIQGHRLGHLQECERFYRWTVSASTQMRMFGDPGKPPAGEDPEKYLDEPLFAKLVAFTDSRLPDVPTGDADYDKLTGKPLAKVVRYAAAPQQENFDKTVDTAKDSDDDDKAGARHETIYSEEQRRRESLFGTGPEYRGGPAPKGIMGRPSRRPRSRVRRSVIAGCTKTVGPKSVWRTCFLGSEKWRQTSFGSRWIASGTKANAPHASAHENVRYARSRVR